MQIIVNLMCQLIMIHICLSKRKMFQNNRLCLMKLVKNFNCNCKKTNILYHIFKFHLVKKMQIYKIWLLIRFTFRNSIWNFWLHFRVVWQQKTHKYLHNGWERKKIAGCTSGAKTTIWNPVHLHFKQNSWWISSSSWIALVPPDRAGFRPELDKNPALSGWSKKWPTI